VHPELVPPEPTINPKQQQLLTSVFTPIQVPASNIKDALSQQKWVLARQLALMCCKDLTPFEVVEKEGFRQFLIQRNAIPSTDLLPCARTLARSALNTAATSQDRELQQYRCLNVSPDDVLEWWRLQRSTFPRLSQLARAILAVPATSAPSERIFSVAGLAINAKRSCLNPNTADKIIFVHENWRFVK
jgi:hypothetical protein